MGGLNDQLATIGRCASYAERVGRDVIVDSRHGGLGVDFGDVFEIRDGEPRLTSVSSYSPEMLNSASTQPDFVQGRLLEDAFPKIKEKVQGRGFSLVDGQVMQVRLDFDDTGKKLSWTALPGFAQDIVFHQGGGGGLGSLKTLHRLRLKSWLVDHIAIRLSDLPEDYVSLHIRCTDLKVNWQAFLKDAAPKLENRNLLVCSDNPEVLATIRDFVPETTIVLTVSDLPQTRGKALHLRGAYRGSENYLINLFVDLFALARGAECVYPLAINQKGQSVVSGFSRLADALNRLPHLQNQVLFGDICDGEDRKTDHTNAVNKERPITEFLRAKDPHYNRFSTDVEQAVLRYML